MFPDRRGLFLEIFNQPDFADAVGHPFEMAQVNCSSSRRGTVRGLHGVAIPPGQARYATCVRGAIVDIVVDTRIGSPTFGEHVPVRLDDEERQALYLAEGLVHGFAPLTDEATVVYLCSSTYDPAASFQIDPFDPALACPGRSTASRSCPSRTGPRRAWPRQPNRGFSPPGRTVRRSARSA
ncbi:dTDP-4-dehydrorhamnose 3,5-epimerase family protein [Micromonospora sp. BRA006-A]|nr:dTDP-4-dehydrorhamnose 3,5-epimerase family protein [Micromonospora sp. BRA006-A]